MRRREATSLAESINYFSEFNFIIRAVKKKIPNFSLFYVYVNEVRTLFLGIRISFRNVVLRESTLRSCGGLDDADDAVLTASRST